VSRDMTIISLSRKNAIADFQVVHTPNPPQTNKAELLIHFNNGVTDYYETCTNWTSI
jgi:hypothetical protein